MPHSKKPEAPSGLANFVAKACQAYDDEEVLEHFREMWREAYSSGDSSMAPTVRSVARAMDLSRDVVGMRCLQLVSKGKMVEYGRNSAKRFVPNEKEFIR